MPTNHQQEVRHSELRQGAVHDAQAEGCNGAAGLGHRKLTKSLGAQTDRCKSSHPAKSRGAINCSMWRSGSSVKANPAAVHKPCKESDAAYLVRTDMNGLDKT